MLWKLKRHFRIGLGLVVDHANGVVTFIDRRFWQRECSQAAHFDSLIDSCRVFSRNEPAVRLQIGGLKPCQNRQSQAARHTPTFVRKVVRFMMSLTENVSVRGKVAAVRRRRHRVFGGSLSRHSERNVITERLVQRISEIRRIAGTRRLPRHRATIPPIFLRSERDGRVNSPCVVDR